MQILNALDLTKSFYLYRHIRPDKDEVFYIGIGRHQRKWKHARVRCLNNRNEYWKNIVNKCNGNFKSEIVFDELTQAEACDKEREFISLYGRSDLGKGTLCNLTDGGEGAFNLSEEAKRKISIKNKTGGSAHFLRNMPTEIAEKRKKAAFKAMTGENNPWYGKVPEKAVAASVKARKGKNRDPDAVKRTADTNRGKKRTEEFCKRTKENAIKQSEERRQRALLQWSKRKEQGFITLKQERSTPSKF